MSAQAMDPIFDSPFTYGWCEKDEAIRRMIDDVRFFLDAIEARLDAAPEMADVHPPSSPRPSRPRLAAEVRWEVWERDEFRCRACDTRRNLTIDHVVPISLGGTDEIENLQTLCGSCNSRKGAR